MRHESLYGKGFAVALPWLATLCLSGLSGPLFAHPAPVSTLVLTNQGPQIRLELSIPLSELAVAAPELTTRDHQLDHDLVMQYLQRHIRLSSAADSELVYAFHPGDSIDYQMDKQALHAVVDASFTRPTGAQTPDFLVTSDFIIHQMVTHDIRVLVRDCTSQQGAALKRVGVIRERHSSLKVTAPECIGDRQR